MEPAPPTTGPSAEDLFADFLERLEAGEQIEFEGWAAGHPHRMAALRRIHQRWRAMTVAFASMSQGPASPSRTADSASLTSLLGRIQNGGERWSRYAIGDEIARGAMGRVVKAWDQELRRDVALKIQRGPGDDGRMRRRFVEEAQIAAQLDHPGIVPIHELGTDADGRPFFAMRLVRGRDLGEVLDLERTGAEGWSRTRVLHVLQRVCEAMAYAHHKGVVHRDLKPANVMVGAFGETYVMDWGLARVVGAPDTSDSERSLDTLRAQIANEDDGSPLLTRDGDVVGTPTYMAPEQAAGAATEVAATTDIYALGAILYHLLAGSPPYQLHKGGLTGNEVLAALRAGPPAPLPDTAPVELRAICEQAMARSPAARYQSVDLLAADLRAFLELRVVSAYATGRFAELRKWIARNRALSLSSALLVLALCVGIVATAHLWLAAESARRDTETSASQLAVELNRSQFRNARQALQLDNPVSAAETLRRHHMRGQTPRATQWALVELAERNPMLASRTLAGNDVAFAHPTGDVLLAGENGQLHVLEALTLQTKTVLGVAGPRLTNVATAPQLPLAVTGDSEGSVALWDLATGSELWRRQDHESAVESLAWSADGESFASGGQDGKLLLWRDRGQVPEELARCGERILSTLFDPKQPRLVFGTAQGDLHVVPTRGGAPFHFRVRDAQLLSLAWGQGENELWVGTTQHTIEIVDLGHRRVDRSIPTRNGSGRALERDPDGSMVVAGWWRIERYVDGTAVERPLALTGSRRIDLDARASLVVSTRLRTLDVIDVADGGLRELPGPLGAFAMSSDGNCTVSRDGNDLVRREIATGREIGRLQTRAATWLIADRDGSRVAMVSANPDRVRLVDFTLPGTELELEGPADLAFQDVVAFRPDGSELAVVVGNDRIRRHAVPSGRVLAETELSGARILRIGYSHDGSHLATIRRGAPDVRLESLVDGSHQELTFDCRTPEAQAANLSAMACNRDGSRVAVGSWGGLAIVRDLRTGREVRLQSHAGTMWNVAFSPNDDDLLITSSGSGGLTFWDLSSGEACYQASRVPGPVSQVRISDDGRTLACRSARGRLVLDLEYFERHVAGTLDEWLAQMTQVSVDPQRLATLREWARTVMARPWPRWQ